MRAIREAVFTALLTALIGARHAALRRFATLPGHARYTASLLADGGSRQVGIARPI
jgi:hypothetical protein